MIDECVNKLMENLPDYITNVEKPEKIDLILEGGVFNGSYLVGALYFLKEMEKRKYLEIERVSGCSIGALIGFLYFINKLDLIPELYTIFDNELRNSYNLKFIKKIKKYLKKYIPKNICEIVNNRLYICYYNVKKQEKIVKSNYENVDDIISSIIKSCHVPFFIDGNILYKNKYVDGIIPYIFNVSDKKILYLDLFGNDKRFNLISVKNEKNNFHRILYGLLDIHTFYIKQQNTQMCSYVNDWNCLNNSSYYLKYLFEKICIFVISIFIFIKEYIFQHIKNTIAYKILYKITQDIFIILFENYCL